MYRITYGYNDRYAGSYEDQAEFETEAQLKDWIIEFECNKRNPRPHANDDICRIIEIIEISQDLTGCFNLEDEIESALKERSAKEKANRLKQREIDEQQKIKKSQEKERKERKKLKELAEKYPEELK